VPLMTLRCYIKKGTEESLCFRKTSAYFWKGLVKVDDAVKRNLKEGHLSLSEGIPFVILTHIYEL
jgi:hypothetical protein